MTTIGVFLGSVRDGRMGEQVAQWVMDAAAQRDADYRLLDLSKFGAPAPASQVMPVMANKSYDDDVVPRWSQAVDACDGFIFATAEYNHSIPGTMKNAFDSLFSEWMGKPVAFVGYGGDGGVRAIEHWRQVTANLSMRDIRNIAALHIFGADATDGQFTPQDSKLATLLNVFADVEAAVSARG